MSKLIPDQWLQNLLPRTPSGRSASGMPVAPGIPLLGSLPNVAVQQLDFFSEACEQCGDIFEVDFGLTKVVMLASPELTSEILIERPKNFEKGGDFWAGIRELLGNGLPVSEGDHWRRQRRLMNPEFRRTRIAAFAELIATGVDEGLEELETLAASGESIPISKWTASLLSRLTIRVLFGGDFDTSRIDSIRNALTTMLDRIMSGVVVRNLPDWVPVPGGEGFAEARKVIDDLIYEVIAERRRNPTDSHDLLNLLIAATDDEGTMSDEQLRDELVSTYLAGYETTAWTLAWGLWLLSEHPQVVRELQAEVDAIENPMKWPLLGATVTEIMRLYPVAPLLPRRAIVDEQLAGYPIPAGTTVVFSPWVLHRNPRIWPDPQRFDPHRHLGEQPQRHRLALMPFGAGQRICIGKGLSLMESHYVLAKLLKRFTPRPGDGPAPRPRLSTTLRSRDEIEIRLQPR